MSQPTPLVAQHLVTTAVTKHGPYSPGLPRPWSATEARTLRLTDAGNSGIRPRDVGMRRLPDGVRVQHGAARCGQNCGHLVVGRAPCVMTEANVHATQKKDADLCLSAFDLRCDLAIRGAGGAWLECNRSKLRQRPWYMRGTDHIYHRGISRDVITGT